MRLVKLFLVSLALSGLANPAHLVFAFSDTGRRGRNSCAAALERRDAAAK